MRLDDLAGYLLGTTYHSMLTLVQRKLQEKDIPLTSEQAKVLNLVHYEPGINQRTIAKILRKDKPGVTRLVEGLERSYLILRKMDKEDRRNRRLFLTNDGEKARDKLVPIMKEMQTLLYDGISEKEIEAFKKTVQKMQQNLKRDLED